MLRGAYEITKQLPQRDGEPLEYRIRSLNELHERMAKDVGAAHVGHRQTKEAATDMCSLQPPRHIPTLPCVASIASLNGRPSMSTRMCRFLPPMLRGGL
jgi:hypothetical protein